MFWRAERNSKARYTLNAAGMSLRTAPSYFDGSPAPPSRLILLAPTCKVPATGRPICTATSNTIRPLRRNNARPRLSPLAGIIHRRNSSVARLLVIGFFLPPPERSTIDPALLYGNVGHEHNHASTLIGWLYPDDCAAGMATRGLRPMNAEPAADKAMFAGSTNNPRSRTPLTRGKRCNSSRPAVLIDDDCQVHLLAPPVGLVTMLVTISRVYPGFSLENQALTRQGWRRRRDSNPRSSF